MITQNGEMGVPRRHRWNLSRLKYKPQPAEDYVTLKIFDPTIREPGGPCEVLVRRMALSLNTSVLNPHACS